MKRHAWKFVAACGIAIALPAAGATLPQPVSRQASAPQGSARALASQKHVCFDSLFYELLPGKTNYCLGLRDWNNGHYDSGLELLKLAAGWGNKSAQYTLGLIYYNGHHVAMNRALGMAWMKLADQRHNDPQIAAVTRSVEKWATPSERAQAEQLYETMRLTYGDKVATARAWHHLRHWQRSHPSGTSGCVDLVGKQAHAALAAGVATPIFTGSTFIICVKMNTFHELVRESAGSYFNGWMGTVSVGPLKAVPAPATSSGH